MPEARHGAGSGADNLAAASQRYQVPDRDLAALLVVGDAGQVIPVVVGGRWLRE
jgi:hypothetical protein